MTTTTDATTLPPLTEAIANEAGFVCLTDWQGRPLFIRVDTIIAVDGGDRQDGTTLTTNMRTANGVSLDWYVEESPNEVIAAIAKARGS